MRYTTYYEENETVRKDKYEQMKQAALTGQPKKKIEKYSLKKLRFMQTGAAGELHNDTVPKYYICMKNNDETQIYIEKKYIQNEIVYKRCVKITKEEAQRILNQDVEWMKGHKKQLLSDFYLQYTLNSLQPKHITEYQREMMNYKKGYITFAHRISRIAGGEVDIFGSNGIPIQCLSEDRVNVSYKWEVTLPQMIMNLIQTAEEPADDFAFAF